MYQDLIASADVKTFTGQRLSRDIGIVDKSINQFNQTEIGPESIIPLMNDDVNDGGLKKPGF